MIQHQSWVLSVGFVLGTVVGSEDKNIKVLCSKSQICCLSRCNWNKPRVLGTRNERPLRNVYVWGGGWRDRGGFQGEEGVSRKN